MCVCVCVCVYIYIYIYIYICRSQWPRGLKRRSAAARLLNLTGGMDVCLL